VRFNGDHHGVTSLKTVILLHSNGLCCCIWQCPIGERILDVVPGWTGCWAGRAHPQ